MRNLQSKTTGTRCCKNLRYGINLVWDTMEDRDAAIADAFEALHINQTALRPAVEEISNWIRQRGSVSVHDNVLISLEVLDLHTNTVSAAIERLRV